MAEKWKYLQIILRVKEVHFFSIASHYNMLMDKSSWTHGTKYEEKKTYSCRHSNILSFKELSYFHITCVS